MAEAEDGRCKWWWMGGVEGENASSQLVDSVLSDSRWLREEWVGFRLFGCLAKMWGSRRLFVL